MTREELARAAAMTVAELIQELQKMPPDAEVWAEGCDCNNPADGVSQDEGRVYITVNSR